VKALGGSLPQLARWVVQQKPARFMIVGMINTAFSYGLYAFFVFMGLRIPMASLAALLLGILFSFSTQGTLVFRNATRLTFIKFVAAWLAIYLVNLGIIEGFMQMGLNAYQSGALATLPVTALSYLILNFIVFRARSA
jgi:putative flippase GtrA